MFLFFFLLMLISSFNLFNVLINHMILVMLKFQLVLTKILVTYVLKFLNFLILFAVMDNHLPITKTTLCNLVTIFSIGAQASEGSIGVDNNFKMMNKNLDHVALQGIFKIPLPGAKSLKKRFPQYDKELVSDAVAISIVGQVLYSFPPIPFCVEPISYVFFNK